LINSVQNWLDLGKIEWIFGQNLVKICPNLIICAQIKILHPQKRPICKTVALAVIEHHKII